MKKVSLAVLLIIGIGMVPLSYGMSKYIPEGSNLSGVYWGYFSGDMALINGMIHIEFYQTPAGKKIVTGVLEYEDTGRSGLFHGELTGNTLKGTLDAPYNGTISGQLSKDGSRLSGTFESIMIGKGAWKAEKE